MLARGSNLKLPKLSNKDELIMPFPEPVASEALVRCARRCCICRKFCGTRMQLHHIKQEAEGGADTLENCIPLCLDCHEEVGSYNSNHPIGRKFSVSELKQHRDLWFDFLATHPERLNSSPEAQFWRPYTEAKQDTDVQGWVEPCYYEATIWSGQGITQIQKEVFGAKVRNKGQRTLFVEDIGFTVGNQRYPGLFSPYSPKPDGLAREIAPGHSQIFNFFKVKLPTESIQLLDGMYLTTGSGHTFENRVDSLARVIREFQNGGTDPRHLILVSETHPST
jgi:hypothetical protein